MFTPKVSGVISTKSAVPKILMIFWLLETNLLAGINVLKEKFGKTSKYEESFRSLLKVYVTR